MPDFMYAWLIPLFPLVGFLINGLFGNKIGKPATGILATVLVFASFVVGCMIFSQLGSDPAWHTAKLYTWFSLPNTNGFPNFSVNMELLIDRLTLLMVLIITGVGGLIHLYSIGYMKADEGFSRFFVYLNLFIFFMLLLVMGNNMLLMFVGWEGVGLCSYLLIGFWYEKKSAADAAKKAMIVNRVGDVGVLIGMFMAFTYFGTLDFHNAAGKGILDLASSSGMAVLIASTPALAAIISTMGLAIFWGCTGKSAQLPLYTWLPDAMEGPTPVSALIHAATMVTAGVYLVSRMHSLFELSPLAMATIAVIGMSTALFAATIGLVQNDIKRVLAYSTCSQLGYMFAACGVGAFSAGMFHVMTHAFFKACLFLGSGVVIHAMEHAMHARHESEHGHDTAHSPVGPYQPDPNDPQDIRNMGGLKKTMPATFWSMAIATAAIAGIPLTSGFFSKDEILYQAATHSWLLWFVGAFTAALTAFYMTRLMYKTFLGSPKTDDATHTHDGPKTMVVPVAILSVLALVGGYIGLPKVMGGSRFADFLSSAAPAEGRGVNEPSEWLLLGISSAIALIFVGLAYKAYADKDGRDLLPQAQKPMSIGYNLLLRKYCIDEAYNFVFVDGGGMLARFLYRIFDLRLVDGIVNGVAWVTGQIGAMVRTSQTGYVRNYAFTMLVGAVVLIIAVLAGIK